MSSDTDQERIPQLDLDSESKNQQRVQEIGESRSMARNQLTQTVPGDQNDEEVLWRMLEAYILEVKPELTDTPLAQKYLQNIELGKINQQTLGHIFAGDVQVLDTNVKTVTGLLQYVTLGPRNIRVTVARPGSSRSSGSDRDTVSLAPPRHISRNALEATNQAFSELGYRLSHGELDVQPDPI